MDVAVFELWERWASTATCSLLVTCGILFGVNFALFIVALLVGLSVLSYCKPDYVKLRQFLNPLLAASIRWWISLKREVTIRWYQLSNRTSQFRSRPRPFQTPRPPGTSFTPIIGSGVVKNRRTPMNTISTSFHVASMQTSTPKERMRSTHLAHMDSGIDGLSPVLNTTMSPMMEKSNYASPVLYRERAMASGPLLGKKPVQSNLITKNMEVEIRSPGFTYRASKWTEQVQKNEDSGMGRMGRYARPLRETHTKMIPGNPIVRVKVAPPLKMFTSPQLSEETRKSVEAMETTRALVEYLKEISRKRTRHIENEDSDLELDEEAQRAPKRRRKDSDPPDPPRDPVVSVALPVITTPAAPTKRLLEDHTKSAPEKRSCVNPIIASYSSSVSRKRNRKVVASDNDDSPTTSPSQKRQTISIEEDVVSEEPREAEVADVITSPPVETPCPTKRHSTGVFKNVYKGLPRPAITPSTVLPLDTPEKDKLRQQQRLETLLRAFSPSKDKPRTPKSVSFLIPDASAQTNTTTTIGSQPTTSAPILGLSSNVASSSFSLPTPVSSSGSFSFLQKPGEEPKENTETTNSETSPKTVVSSAEIATSNAKTVQSTTSTASPQFSFGSSGNAPTTSGEGTSAEAPAKSLETIFGPSKSAVASAFESAATSSGFTDFGDSSKPSITGSDEPEKATSPSQPPPPYTLTSFQASPSRLPKSESADVSVTLSLPLRKTPLPGSSSPAPTAFLSSPAAVPAFGTSAIATTGTSSSLKDIGTSSANAVFGSIAASITNAFGGTPSLSTGLGGNVETVSASGTTTPSSTPLFGTSSSSISPLGKNVTTSVFSMIAASSSPAFNVSTNSSAFGTSVQSPAPAFGLSSTSSTPAFGSNTSSTPAFGSSTAAANPAFGTTTTSSAPAFGTSSTAASLTFGTTTTSATPAFGTNTAPATLTFGTATTTASATSMTSSFGVTATPTLGDTTNSATPAFGATGTAVAGITTISNVTSFGAPTTSTTFTFGASSSATTPAFATNTTSTTFTFGTPTTSATAAFGTVSTPFGVAPTSTTPAFGTTSATPGFGTSAASVATPLFGAGTSATAGVSSASVAFPSAFATSQPVATTVSSSLLPSNTTTSFTSAFGTSIPSTTFSFGKSEASSTSIFGSNSVSSTPAFGTGTTVTTTTSASVFGSSSVPAFGSTAATSNNAFGSPMPSATPAFASTVQPTAPNFGASSTSNTGAAAPTFAFGSGTTPSIFSSNNPATAASGAPPAAPSLFGSTPASTTGGFVFGTPSAGPTTGSLFGSVTTPMTTKPQATVLPQVFGSIPETSTANFGSFSGSSSASQFSGAFGASGTPAPKPAEPARSLFGSGTVTAFGSTPQAGSAQTPLFGASSATPTTTPAAPQASGGFSFNAPSTSGGFSFGAGTPGANRAVFQFGQGPAPSSTDAPPGGSMFSIGSGSTAQRPKPQTARRRTGKNKPR